MQICSYTARANTILTGTIALQKKGVHEDQEWKKCKQVSSPHEPSPYRCHVLFTIVDILISFTFPLPDLNRSAAFVSTLRNS